MARPWQGSRGLARLLAQETNVSDFIQLLSDCDPDPWRQIVGFVPVEVRREARLGKTSSRTNAGNADLLLTATDGRRALIEVKLGHLLSHDQQEKYEDWHPDTTSLYLAGLAADAHRIDGAESERWSFISLADLVGRWRASQDEAARLWADAICAVITEWDNLIGSVLHPDGRTLDALTAKFITRVVTRRIAANLSERGYDAIARVTSGGGLPVVQAWIPVTDDRDDEKWFIAEVRWRETKPGGELRFGVDYWTDHTPEFRREAHDLAHSMIGILDASALRAHMSDVAPHLRTALTRVGSGRPRPTAPGDVKWDDVIEHGFGSPELTRNGRKLTRQSVNPGFYGDGALRFEALTDLDFTRLHGQDLVELIDLTLQHMRQHMASPR